MADFLGKKSILVTGASGFIGRNLKESLSERYTVFAPSHQELDLLNFQQVEQYIAERHIDVVVHAAVNLPEPHSVGLEFHHDMQMFLNLEKLSGRLEKLIYFGSGAEFDKRFDIRMATEDAFGRSVPTVEYGMAKYIMNKLAQRSENIYNLRLFGVFGKYELWKIKFLSNLCCKAVFGLPLTVRKDCWFDFLYIDDLTDIVIWFLKNTPRFHDYNVGHGQEYRLTELAELVRKVSGKDLPIVLLSEERNLDYSADTSRIKREITDLHITPMEQALAQLYNYYEEHRELIDQNILRESR